VVTLCCCPVSQSLGFGSKLFFSSAKRYDSFRLDPLPFASGVEVGLLSHPGQFNFALSGALLQLLSQVVAFCLQPQLRFFSETLYLSVFLS
jgi:hypothetical protein